MVHAKHQKWVQDVLSNFYVYYDPQNVQIGLYDKKHDISKVQKNIHEKIYISIRSIGHIKSMNSEDFPCCRIWKR